jgi:hypothetical protein
MGRGEDLQEELARDLLVEGGGTQVDGLVQVIRGAW